MIVNFVHEAGFLPSILVFLLAIGPLYIVTKLPDGCLAITAACMLFSIHLSRNDAEMLRILSPRLPKQVLIVDYYLAMLPFATASLCTGSVKNVSCCLLLPACLALVPHIHADGKFQNAFYSVPAAMFRCCNGLFVQQHQPVDCLYTGFCVPAQQLTVPELIPAPPLLL